MNKKEKTTEIRIVPCGERPLVNGESATTGEASECVNLREREQSLVPMGAPETVAQLVNDERLLTIDGDRLITLLGNELRCNGTAFATVESAVKGAVMTGDFLVLNTAEGIEYYVRTAAAYSHLDISAAVPQVNLSALTNLDVSESFPEFSFAEPLTQWRVPLSQTDEAALLSALQAIRFSMLTRVAGEGRYATPFLARYAVRLWDDSYLWVSQPVLLAANLVHPNYRTASEATTSSSAFTGIAACNVTMGTCRLGIEVLSGVQAQWKGLVKAVDVLVATDARLVDVASLDYRMGTTTYNGSRRYNIEFGFAPKSASEVVAHLLKSNWRVVASTTAIDALDLHQFVAPNLTNVGTGLLSGGVVAALLFELPSSHVFKCDYFGTLSSSLSHRLLPESIMSHNGRLHACGGEWQSEVGWGVMPWVKSAAAGECEAVISVTMAHRGGTSTAVRHETLPVTPLTIGPLLAVAGISATHVRVDLIASGGRWHFERYLAPMENCGMSLWTESTLGDIILESGATTNIVPINNNVSAGGDVLVHEIDNPLVISGTCHVSGAEVIGLGVLAKPLYNGGFGRYQLCVFTSTGTYAISQNIGGAFGDARLLTRHVLKARTLPVEGRGELWMLTAGGKLVSLRGSAVIERMRNCEANWLAWNDAENELVMLDGEGEMMVLQPSGRLMRRTIEAASLYSEPNVALAVTAAGEVLDLSRETPAPTAVTYRSHPITLDVLCRMTPTMLVWEAFGDCEQLSLRLLGERGVSCHGFTIVAVTAHGSVNAPLALPLLSQPSRTIRLELTGTVAPGFIILPATLRTTSR